MDVKYRILQFIKLQNIKRKDFCAKTGLSSAFLDKKGGVTSGNLEAISESFPDLSIEWLVKGTGEMLRANQPDPPLTTPMHDDIEAIKLLIEEKDRSIATLTAQIADLRSQLKVKDEQLAAKDAQLAARDRMMCKLMGVEDSR